MGATGEPTGRKRDDPFTRLHRLEVLGQIANLLVAVAIHARRRHGHCCGGVPMSAEPTGRASEGPRCLCSWNGEKWLTPPSCPYHGIRHLRERFADVIAAEPYSVFADLREAEQRAAEATQRLEEAAKVIGWIRRDRREPDKVLMYCDTFLARESSEGVSSGPDGTDESERNEHG
jgi:hypothetical protein